MALPREHFESLLRARQLDRTLTTAIPAADTRDESTLAPSSLDVLDARLGGGFPRGQLSEIVGARSSGRASLMLRMLAAATARGELTALVDVVDMLDVESASAAGIDLSRLLWIRGHVVVHPGPCRDLNQRALEQAIRALTLVLQAGNFGLVVFDVGEAPADAIRRLPFTTWLRLQRMVEGSQTTCVLVGGEAMARSSAGLTLKLTQEPTKKLTHELAQKLTQKVAPRGIRFGHGWFDGIDVEARIVRARAREREDVRVSVSTTCA
jgi:hypothetical protein